MRIVNLTQHNATPEQIEAGVYDLSEDKRAELCKLLTFDEIPTAQEMLNRAKVIVSLADEKHAMIGGAPFFMSYLEGILFEAGIEALYAFSKREVVEVHNPDGSVTKNAVFKHIGFVKA